MLKIRLARHGAKKRPFYRIVIIDDSKKPKGKAKDIIGFWNPKKKERKIDFEKLKYYIGIGAQQTPAVKKLISK